MAIVFLRLLPVEEAITLLGERRRVVSEHRLKTVAELGDVNRDNILAFIAADHMVSLIETELAWLDRSLALLKENGWSEDTPSHQSQKPEDEQNE